MDSSLSAADAGRVEAVPRKRPKCAVTSAQALLLGVACVMVTAALAGIVGGGSLHSTSSMSGAPLPHPQCGSPYETICVADSPGLCGRHCSDAARGDGDARYPCRWSPPKSGQDPLRFVKPSCKTYKENTWLAKDRGYPDSYRGYYDHQGCGRCTDYCRWVGNSGSGGDPARRTTYGSSFWSCVGESGYQKHQHFTAKKCRRKGAHSGGLSPTLSDSRGWKSPWSGVDRRCDRLPGPGSPPTAAHQTIGGGRWYRFAGRASALPTAPEAADCQDQGASGAAWLSGWPVTAGAAPPADYARPGSLPGDGPQGGGNDARQLYTACFNTPQPWHELSGHEVCEHSTPPHNSNECKLLGCCKYSAGKCLSNVGSGRCTAPRGVNVEVYRYHLRERTTCMGSMLLQNIK